MMPFALPTTGWTYCPRCDQDNMVAIEPGQLYDCPMCGMGLRVTSMGGLPALEATQPLQFEEMIRYRNYLMELAKVMMQEAQTRAKQQYKIPRRVRLYIRLCNWLGMVLGCKVNTVEDKKVMEVRGE